VFRFDSHWLKEKPTGSFSVQRDVRLQEVDAAGIVFFARTFEYVSDTFAAFCKCHDVPLANALKQRRWAAPLRHVEADYLSPLRFGDRLDVALVGAHIEPTQVTLGYRLALVPDDVVTTLVQTLHVFVDPQTFERRQIPEKIERALSGWCRLWPG
jgi:YbgC/YbaW family acyl-CoA thioester hydrolase